MTIDYLAHLRADSGALEAVLAIGPLGTPVPSCPGWDLARLAGHIGRVQRWCTETVRTGTSPDMATIEKPPSDAGAAAAYFAGGVEPLLAALASRPVDDPCWNFTGLDQTVGFWSRRQAHEAAVHRWDAQNALGAGAPIDAELAADGIDEMLGTMGAFRFSSKAETPALGSFHVHCTDLDGEWTVTVDDGALRLERGHTKGDAALRGPAGDLLLVLWGRLPVDTDRCERFGTVDAVAAWVTALTG